jgi:hypothetical protein
LKTHQPDEECPRCHEQYKKSSLSKHIKNCRELDDADDEFELQSEAKEAIDPLFRAPISGITRSAHAAPKQSYVDKLMQEYIEWIESPTALGKSTLIKNSAAFIDKFRTTLGRLATFHHITAEDLLGRIGRGRAWSQYFAHDKLNDFTMSLATTDRGRPLRKSTVYNYIRTLIVFFEWKVDVKGCENMRSTLELLKKLNRCLNLQKQRERDPEAKSVRFDAMPSFPEMLAFLSQELREKAVNAYREFKDLQPVTKIMMWDVYVSCRNYILVAMLIGIPPQRATVFNTVSLLDLQEQDGHAILTIKNHKTDYRYGPVVIAIPPHYKKQFDEYLEVRGELAQAGINSLFLNKNGEQEKYLTKRFQGIMDDKFGCNITIRDCRSLYITYASQHLDITKLQQLSRLMFHSLEIQQTVYRSDNSVERAITSLNSTTRALPAMMSMYADEEFEDSSIGDNDPDSFEGISATIGEFDDIPDELFFELVETHNKANQMHI